MLELTNTAYDKKQKGQIWAFFYSLQDSKCHTAIWKITVNVFSDVHLIWATQLETWTSFTGKL